MSEFFISKLEIEQILAFLKVTDNMSFHLIIFLYPKKPFVSKSNAIFKYYSLARPKDE